MTHDTPELPPAGWHPDPTGSGYERFWDGSIWTEQLRTAEPGFSDAAQTQEFFADAGEPVEAGSGEPTGAALGEPGVTQEASVPPFGRQEAATPYAAYIPQVPQAPQAPQVPQAPQFPYAQQPAAATAAPGEAGFFRSLFDLTFAPDRVVTIKFARVLYILATVSSMLLWIVGALFWFVVSGVSDEGGFVVLGVLQLLFGWILPLLTVVGFRVSLEVMISVIRTSQHTAQLVQQGYRSGM